MVGLATIFVAGPSELLKSPSDLGKCLSLNTHSIPEWEAFTMDAIRLAQPRTVTGDAEGLVSRGGLVWLSETADLTGLTAG